MDRGGGLTTGQAKLLRANPDPDLAQVHERRSFRACRTTAPVSQGRHRGASLFACTFFPELKSLADVTSQRAIQCRGNCCHEGR